LTVPSLLKYKFHLQFLPYKKTFLSENLLYLSYFDPLSFDFTSICFSIGNLYGAKRNLQKFCELSKKTFLFLNSYLLKEIFFEKFNKIFTCIKIFKEILFERNEKA